MMAREIFISYKSEDFDKANEIREMLEQRGATCWMAPQDIPGGSSYAAEIPSAIKACKVFLLVFSSKTQASRWVSRELDQAINQSKTILPFLLEECEMGDEFGFYLTNIQHYEGYRNREAVLERLIKDVFAALGRQPLIPVAQPPEESPAETSVAQPSKADPAPEAAPKATSVKQPSRKRRGLLPLAIAAAIAVIVVAGFAVKSVLGYVEIAGTRYEKSASSVTLTQVTLTQQDMDQFAKLTDCMRITMTDCVIEASSLNALLNERVYSLELVNCGITDAMLHGTDFSKAPRLDRLNLNSNTAVTDIAPLTILADQLTELELADLRVSNPDRLSMFNQLELLRVDNTSLTNLQPLETMIYLKKLYASNNAIASLDGLKNATLLETVDLRGNRLQNVQVLSKSADTLRHVYVSDNMLKELTAFESCTGLRTLVADRNELTNLYGIGDCAELETLSAQGNALESETGLPAHGKVCYLDLSNNRLAKVTLDNVLSQEYSVKVDLSHNHLTYVSLPFETNYHTLALHDNSIQLHVEQYGALKGSYLFISWSDRVIDNAFYMVKLADCPLDRRVEIEKLITGVEFLTVEELDKATNERMDDALR